MNWQGKKVCVTGGASFIGSHLVDNLVRLGARVRVVDDLSSGKVSNIQRHIDSGAIDFYQRRLWSDRSCQEAVAGQEVVFHLANAHGGRGYVDSHQVACAQNMVIDGHIFAAAAFYGAKVVYASSACVYPTARLNDPTEKLYLTEDMVGPGYDADNMYGWAKLMGEMTLKAYHNEQGLKAVSCRYFHVYGERAVINHALIAMIARASAKQDPFEVWGTGEQVRNWTHIDDVVRGTLLAAEEIDDATAINIGTEDRIRVIDAVNTILDYVGHHPRIEFKPSMPTGPYNRVGSNALAKHLLGFEPLVSFQDGVKRTVDWYYATVKPDYRDMGLTMMLSERGE